MDIIEVLCNTCGYERFSVIKPGFDLEESNSYFMCRNCLHKKVMKQYSNQTLQDKNEE